MNVLEKILEEIEEATFQEDAPIYMECCDYCFGHDLTKEECKELSEVFRELAEELEK